MPERRALLALGLLVCLAASACAGPAPVMTPLPTATPAPPARRVIVISIDGLRPDEITQGNVPYLRQFAARGAYSWAAQTITPSLTLPAHASMISGLPPRTHGVTWNDDRPGVGLLTAPTMFSIARAAGFRTVAVVGKAKFDDLLAPDSLGVYIFAPGGDQNVADAARNEISIGFDLLFVHLPDNDQAGHAQGWMSAVQLDQLHDTDDTLGRLLAAVPPDTVVILTADHGGHGMGHGGTAPEDMTIPWMILGPGVHVNYPLTGPVSVMDTAATALKVLGLSLPAGAEGKVVAEAFE
jgi:predicted AlkP superfamily pyrophosphatase or phosphodiesterase